MGSGIEIDPESDARREDDQISEIWADPHCEIETISDVEKWPVEAESIIKLKRRVEASSQAKEIDSIGKYSLSSIPKSGIADAPWANQGLLGGLKTQEDVKMYIRLPDNDDFRRFDFPSEADLSAISNRLYQGFAKPHLNIICLSPNIRNKLFKPLRELRLQDRKANVSKNDCFREYPEIHIPELSMS